MIHTAELYRPLFLHYYQPASMKTTIGTTILAIHLLLLLSAPQEHGALAFLVMPQNNPTKNTSTRTINTCLYERIDGNPPPFSTSSNDDDNSTPGEQQRQQQQQDTTDMNKANRFSKFAPSVDLSTEEFRKQLKENMKADLERRRQQDPTRGNQPAKSYLDSL